MSESIREGDSDGRLSSEQKIHLIEYMEDHSDFARGKFIGVEGKITLQNLWEILAEQLNVLGPRKSAAKWKRAWFDLKTKTKRKAAMARKLSVMTEGGSAPTPLTDLDKRLIKIISVGAVYGLQSGDVVLESEEPHKQSSTPTTSQAPNIDVETPSASQTPSLSARPSDKPTPSTSKAVDHNYCDSYIMLSDDEETDCSSDTTPGSKRKRSFNREAIEYFQESDKKFDKKIDTAIALLKENNETLKDTNKLLKELIDVIKKK